MQQRPKALLQDHEWSQATVDEELKQVYGRTYLSLFAEDYTILDQPWVKDEDLK